MQDLHIHMHAGRKDAPEVFKAKTVEAGVRGGAVFSMHPEGYRVEPDEDQRWQHRAEFIMEYCSQAPGFRPLFWIDPTDADAVEQVIDGGCHAGFGMYGAQEGDGVPSVSNEEQISQTADRQILPSYFRVPQSAEAVLFP